jgi:hypothetical protein
VDVRFGAALAIKVPAKPIDTAVLSLELWFLGIIPNPLFRIRAIDPNKYVGHETTPLRGMFGAALPR